MTAGAEAWAARLPTWRDYTPGTPVVGYRREIVASLVARMQAEGWTLDEVCELVERVFENAQG